MFIGKYNGSVILTYLGVSLALIGLAFLLDGSVGLAMIGLILAGVCDLFDGAVAARFHRDEEARAFGREIDSLADTISFLALPAAMVLVLAGTGPLAMAAAIAYVLAGIIRLGFFNIRGTEETSEGRYYRGLPVTWAALIFPVLHLPLSFLPEAVFTILWPVLVLVVALAFIVDWKVKKPDRAMSLKLAAFAAFMVAVYAMEVILR